MVQVIGGCVPARSAGMLVVGQPLPCYHLETDGSDNADVPNRDVLVHHETTSRPSKAHGYLPTDADLAFALGTLKHGGLDPAVGAAHVTSDPVVKLRHDVFAAFNKCLVRYLTVCIGPSIDGNGGNALGILHTDDGSGCQLCIIVSRLALHSSACEEHYLVCSDFCLPLYNLIDYHLGSCCRRSLCDASLCDELRTVVLQSQPMERRSHALDRAWYRLRSRLSGALLPLQRAATSAEVQELARRMVGPRLCGGAAPGDRGAAGGGGAGTVSEPSSSAVDADADATSVRLRLSGNAMQATERPIRHSPNVAGCRRHSSNSPTGSGVTGDCSEDGTGSSCSSSSCHLSANSPDQNFPLCNRPTDLTRLIFKDSIPTGAELEVRLANAVDELGHMAVHARMPSAGSFGNDALDSGGLKESVDDIGRLPRLSMLCPSEHSTADDDDERADSKPQKHPSNHTAAEHPVLAPSSSLLDASRPFVGRGRVAYGEPRHLLDLVQYWRSLQERLHNGLPCNDDVTDNWDSDIWEGIILTGKDSQLRVQEGNYQKHVHWTKQTFLGRGVSGQVHLAIDNESEFSFVIKKVELHDFTHEELCVWAELEHPGIVQLYGALRHGQKLYYLCEFYAGGTLSALVQRSHALDQWKTLFYMDQILNALAYLHEKRIIHEDLKADNIYLKLESHVLGIGDFGLSCKLRPGQSNVVPGKQPLGGQTQWSPEKARSDGHGFAADIWAAMCTMVHMLSGHHPWEQRFKGCPLLHFIIALNSPPKDDIPHGLLDEVVDLIMCGWEMEPHQRPTASKLLQHQCFDHLRNGSPGDPKYASHFPHLLLVLDDVFDSHAADHCEELDEDGENYIAEIVERVRRESAGQNVVAEEEGVNALGARAGPVHVLSTEHDIRTSATAAASSAIIASSGSSSGLADCPSSAGIARQPQQDAGNEAEGSNSPVRFDWCGTTGPPLVSKECYHDKGAMQLTRPRCFFGEVIEEEQPLSSLSDDMRMEPSSSLSSPPLLTAAADVLSSSSSSSIATATVSGSSKQKRRINPGLYVNVHVTSPTRTVASPVSPSSQQLRHSHSLDGGQPTPGSAGSGGGEGKPRSLRHSVTSPSVLMTRSNAFDDGVGEQQPRVLLLQHCTPPSAGSSSLALRSSDLNATGPLVTPVTLLPDIMLKRQSTTSSSAYGSSTPHQLSTSFDGPTSLPAAATRSAAMRDSSQGYGTGCSAATPESACSVFAVCGETPPTSKVGVRHPRPNLASLSQQKQHAYPATSPGLHFTARLQHDAAQRPPASSSPASSSPATDNTDTGGTLAGPQLSSGPAPSMDGQLSAPMLPARLETIAASANATLPQDAPGAVPADGAGPPSLLNPDTSFIITSSDYEMDPAPTNDSADDLTRAGARVADLAPDGFDLRLPEEQEQRPQLDKDESSSDDEEYLSILKQSLKQSGSLNDPYAVFVAGDRCYKLSKDQEIGKLKLCHDMTWQDAVLLMSAKVHVSGFESFTVLHEDGREINLYEKIPFQPVVLTVRTAADGGPWQWWIYNRAITYNDENGHHGPFLDSRT